MRWLGSKELTTHTVTTLESPGPSTLSRVDPNAFAELYAVKRRGMKRMLEYYGREIEGNHHSGIDDCRNIARICTEMLKDGWKPIRTNI